MNKIKTDGSIQGIFGFNPETKVLRPLIGTSIPAGFPSPATDYIEGLLDLNVYLIQHKQATFFVKADGYSMINAGISPGDLLVVDKSLEAAHKNVVIAYLNGEFTVKRIHFSEEGYWLVPENDEFEPVQITASDDFQIWGVVTYVIHKI